MKKQLLLNISSIILLLITIHLSAQVSINTDGSLPDNSAILDLKSESKGILLPRVTLTATNVAYPVTSPAIGLHVYNIADAGTSPYNVTPGTYCWDGSQWIPIFAPRGGNIGDMQYWNGTQWVIVSGGSYGQTLTYCNGIPSWSGCIPLLTTTAVTSITTTYAYSGGTITNSGAATITAKGVCWSTSPNPTTANSKTTDGTGSGSYSSYMSGLTINTIYYVRAYATNSAGTGYGNELSFTTQNGIASLTTTAASSITAISAASGGAITSDGGASITTKGVCWNTSPGPTTANFKTTNGTGTGSFSSSLTGLTANTLYYVRAYATNNVGTYYGNEITFTTLTGVVSLTTTAASSITAISASSGGIITNDGGASVTARGVCWNTVPNPTTANFKTTNGTGTGTLTSSLTGLTANTIYYIRAYATNSVGTSYGNELNFTTLDGVIILSTTAISNILAGGATSGGNITNNGGAAVTARGVCWSLSTNPTTSDSKTTDGSGSGTYTSNLSGLLISTLYYVRAYAINSIGTSYGNQLSFTTSGPCPGTPTVLYGGQTYNTIQIGTQCWLKENLNIGTKIPMNNNDQTNNGIIEKYCYDDLESNCDLYGGLYQWAEMVQYLNGAGNWNSWSPEPTGNVAGICMPGWHIPTEAEWITLSNTLGGNSVAGGKMKETGTIHWASPNVATNESGFTALPGGAGNTDYGNGINIQAYFQSITQSGSPYYPSFVRINWLPYDGTEIYFTDDYKVRSESVRCLKD